MSPDADTRRSPKLPLRATIRLAYQSFFTHFGDLLRISWVWIVICALLSTTSSWLKTFSTTSMLRSDTMRPAPIHAWAIDIALLVAFIIAGFSIAVAWHRVLILHEAPQPSGSNIATARVWRYAGMTLLIMLLSCIPAIVPIAASPHASMSDVILGIFVLPVIATLIGGRLSIVLPSLAVDERPLTLSWAWGLTSGNSWRLFWSYFACTLPPLVLPQFVLLVVLPAPAKASAPAFVVETAAIDIVYTLSYMLILPIMIGFLSHAYPHFSRRRTEHLSSPVAIPRA